MTLEPVIEGCARRGTVVRQRASLGQECGQRRELRGVGEMHRLRRKQLAKAARAIGLDRLAEPAEHLVADHDLRE